MINYPVSVNYALVKPLEALGQAWEDFNNQHLWLDQMFDC